MATTKTTTEELRQQLEALKAKAALPALSAEDEERAALRAELAQAKAKIEANEKKAREAKEDDIFERLEAKYSGTELHRIDAEGGMIVLRSPSVAKSRHFQQVALKSKLSPDAIEDFVKPCVVCPCNEETLAPDLDALEVRLEKHTLLAATLCQFAQEIGSAEAKRRGSK